MKKLWQYSGKHLYDFIDRAGKATYAGQGKEVGKPERPGFTEFEYTEGYFSYRDSYVGDNRSRGMEVVRHKDIPIWASTYGGGIIEGKEYLDPGIINILKKALAKDEEGFMSFRGPHESIIGDWKYIYKQDGDVHEFSGYEEIYYKGELVFFHRIIGGIINYA